MTDHADHSSADSIDQGRRQFLRRAGLATVWAVPTVQVLQMAAARATEVRSSITTTSDQTTTQPSTLTST